MLNETLTGEMAIVLVLLGVWAVALRDAWRAWQPARLLLAGRYAEARVAAIRLERSWMRIFPSIRISARYAIGCALHFEGDLEGSLATLEPLHAERLRGDMRYAICSIEAASLILLDREHARASLLLEEAAPVLRPPEDILLAALAKLGQGVIVDAEGLFASAGTERAVGRIRLKSMLLLEDPRQQEIIFHTLRGLYLLKVGRTSEAKRDIDLAAKDPMFNVYVERARAVGQVREVDPAGDPRSSLAPQVVENDEPAL